MRLSTTTPPAYLCSYHWLIHELHRLFFMWRSNINLHLPPTAVLGWSCIPNLHCREGVTICLTLCDCLNHETHILHLHCREGVTISVAELKSFVKQWLLRPSMAASGRSQLRCLHDAYDALPAASAVPGAVNGAVPGTDAA
jgi:hypothetical protein